MGLIITTMNNDQMSGDIEQETFGTSRTTSIAPLIALYREVNDE
jgi:hypothetical protein